MSGTDRELGKFINPHGDGQDISLMESTLTAWRVDGEWKYPDNTKVIVKGNTTTIIKPDGTIKTYSLGD